MKPIDFKEKTHILNKPPHMIDEQYQDLPVFSDGVQHISKWELDEEEKEHIFEKGYIYIIVLGQAHPPICPVASSDMFKEVEKKPDIKIVSNNIGQKVIDDIMNKAQKKIKLSFSTKFNYT